MGAAGADKIDVGNKNGDPGQDTEDGDEVDKVVEDVCGGLGDVEEGDEGDGGGESESVNGDTAAVSTSEDGEGVSFFGEAVEGSCSDVEVRVCSAEDENEDAGVKEAGEGADAGVDDGDYEGGGGGPGFLLGGKSEFGVVVGDQHADKENGDDVEDENSPEGQPDGFGNDSAGVLRFPNGDPDQFGTKVSKGCGDERTPESEEAACVSSSVTLLEGSWILPVTETLVTVSSGDHVVGGQLSAYLPIMIRSASKRQYKTENDQRADS